MADYIRRIIPEETLALFPALVRLNKQLSPDALPVILEQAEQCLHSENTALFGAFSGEKLIGMTLLASVPLLNKTIGFIEAVVVDSSCRGRGLGKALVKAALEFARDQGFAACNLTSRPERTAANRMYLDLGFERQETNVYRYRFDKKQPHGLP